MSEASEQTEKTEQSPLILCVNAHPFAHWEPFTCFPSLSSSSSWVAHLFTDPPFNPHFYPRDLTEEDESRRQIIPYCVLTHAGQVFTYLRNASSGEARLHRKRSLGVGGHIEAFDMGYGQDDKDKWSAKFLGVSGFYEALARELREEVNIRTLITQSRCAGVIADNADLVGRVHLGIVFAIHLATDFVFPKEECREGMEWMEREELVVRRDGFEGWSRIVIDNLLYIL